MEQAPRSTTARMLSILGFIAALVFFVWLAVQLVSVLPSAFSSLASLYNSLNERPQREIVIVNSNTIVANGEGFTLAWSDLNRPGTYTFSYLCADGVALDIRHPGNRITSVNCGETIELGNMITSLEVITASEKRRFTDVSYIIGFIPEGEQEVAYSSTATFTIVNASIPQSQSGIATDEPAEDEPAPIVAGDSTDTPVTPTPVKPGTPTVIETPIYAIPQSDPNGTVDLAVRFLGVGTMDSDNDFTPRGVIDKDARGAFQFEVKNLGTKTSDEWTFVATLTSGEEYESKEQAPLKPNERSVITLGFDSVGETGAQTFGARAIVDNDVNRNNNRFTWAVNVTN